MEELRNKNMEDEFNPGRINVLDKSTMEWYNDYSPSFMCVGRNPHPFDNDSHTIFCGLMSILRRAQIAEGKDRPS